jgi:predicted amidophosphoribosyltransferase
MARSQKLMSVLGAELWRSALDFAFPPECIGCYVDLPEETGPSLGQRLLWCSECREKICNQPENCCPSCGAERNPAKFPGGRCSLCRGMKLHFEFSVCVGNYTGVMQDLIVRLKGTFDEVLALQFGRLLGQRIAMNPLPLECDMIVTTPTHWWNRFRRPSFLVGVIAEGVAGQVGLPIEGNALHCIKRTKKQGLLSTPQRFENVAKAFGVSNPKVVAGKSVLLIDDVVTSGATANQIAKVLKRAGARRVVIGALARGVRHAVS